MASRPELLRIARRLRNASGHYRALQVAVGQFGEDFDQAAWRQSFESDEADQINRVMQVTGDFEHLTNNLIEVLKAGARNADLVEGRRPRAEGAIDAIHRDGGLSARQVELLGRLYIMRGRLQHASPDVRAEEVRGYVLLLLDRFPKLFRDIIDWLAKHGLVAR